MHNHITIMNHDFATGKIPKQAGYWFTIVRTNDELMQKMGLSVCESKEVTDRTPREDFVVSADEYSWKETIRRRADMLAADERVTDLATAVTHAEDYDLELRVRGKRDITYYALDTDKQWRVRGRKLGDRYTQAGYQAYINGLDGQERGGRGQKEHSQD